MRRLRNFYMVFTSSKNPALWREDFEEDATLLCTLDRIFDDVTAFKLRGKSFRGKKLEIGFSANRKAICN